MAITHPAKRSTDWRPRSLRFAHWRDGGHVAFAQDGRRPDGHDSLDRYALMVHLAHHHPALELEVDGTRLSGRLGTPDDDGRTPFAVPAYDDGSHPRPTRRLGWLRWTEGTTRHLAECAIALGDPERPDTWLLSIPRAVESDDRRLLPRQDMAPGWFVETAASAPEALRGRHPVRDLSLVGAAVFLADLLTEEMVLDQRFVGNLLPPGRPPIRIQAAVRNLRQVDGGAVLGLSTHGPGFHGVHTLDRLLDYR